MPMGVGPVSDEKDGLLAYLSQQRCALRCAAYGLTDEQAKMTPTPSELSVGGLIKHAAIVERGWIDKIADNSESSFSDYQAYSQSFRLQRGETLASVLELYEAAARRTEVVVAEISDLGQAVPVPKGVPWFPDDVEAWSVRWVLLHLVEETARHAGHADMVREAIDGATSGPLIAVAKGWAPTDWLKPWEPARSSA